MTNGIESDSSAPRSPLVSIAMCTFNGERFLRQQLDSLIGQDYPNLEIIITDDCSSDSTFTILQEYAEKNDRITVFQHETNLGLKRNFEQALSKCSGDFIALCDQDDIWYPEKISTLVEQIGSSALIYTPVQMIDENDQRMDQNFFARRNIQPVSGKCSKALVFDNCILGHTTLFKRELLETVLPFPQGIPAHDQWISFMAATSGEIQFYDRVLSSYRMHRDNAALKNRGQKKTSKGVAGRKNDRIKTLKKKHQRQQDYLNLLAELDVLPEDDKQLYRNIAQSYSRFYRVWNNGKLANLLTQEGDAFLAISRDKKKTLRKICRGYLAGVFR